jgi:hypothetical protein
VIDGSSRHVYVSVNCADPQGIAAAIGRADGRGVVCDVLHFGEPIVELRHGRTVGHGSPRGVVYAGTRRDTWRWSPTAPMRCGRWPRTA